MKYEVIYPDGKRETLLDVRRYNFNWQTLYKLKNPVAIPKGSRLMVSAVFDNSTKNKLNPDPAKIVRFGEPTYDEMLVGFVDYARPKPAEKTVAKVEASILEKYVGDYAKRLEWLTGFKGSAGAASVLAERAAIFVDGRYA